MKQTLPLFFLLFFSFSSNAQISTIAGSGSTGNSGDGGPAISAKLNLPDGIAIDKSGNIFIADTYNHRIRKIARTGIITTVAGNSFGGYGGDGGAATLAFLYYPEAVTVDSFGNIFIADFGNQVIRKVDTNGIISTFAGNHSGGYGGDGGPATLASLNGPYDLCLDTAGNLIIADWRNNRIRKVDKKGIISTVAGTGLAGYNGDNIKATSAQLNNPYGVTVDITGNIYIGDTYNNRVRKVSIADSTITTIAGTGITGATGDGNNAINATLNSPIGLQFDSSGNLLIADAANNKVRKIDKHGIITSIAGTGVAGYSGDGGKPLLAKLNYPIRLALNKAGEIFVAERDNDLIRKIVLVDSLLLPVTITNFNAYRSGKNIELNWEGYNEVNLAGYDIERSANGYSYNKIGSVYALGNSSSKNGYNWVDENPAAGINYYRLKALSKDASIQYSRIVKVSSTDNVISGVNVYPNPAVNKVINLRLNNIEANTYNILVFNMAGKQIFAQQYKHSGGNATILININGGAKGIYKVLVDGPKVKQGTTVLLQ